MRWLIPAVAGLLATVATPAMGAGLQHLPLPPHNVDLGGPPLWKGLIASNAAPARTRKNAAPRRPAPSAPDNKPRYAIGRPFIKFYKKAFAAGECLDYEVGFKPVRGQKTVLADLLTVAQTIDAPDGTHQRYGNNTMYSGFFPEDGWSEPRSIPSALAGTYILTYAIHRFTTGKVTVQVQALPPLEKIKFAFEWSKTGDITRKSPLPVALCVTNNSDQTIRFPARTGRNPSDSYIQLNVLRNEPAAESGWWDESDLRPPQSARIEMVDYPVVPWRRPNMCASIVLRPGETFRQDLSLHDVMDRMPESVWREGPFQIELRTNVYLIIGEGNGPWSRFNPVHLVLDDRKDFRLLPTTTGSAS